MEIIRGHGDLPQFLIKDGIKYKAKYMSDMTTFDAWEKVGPATAEEIKNAKSKRKVEKNPNKLHGGNQKRIWFSGNYAAHSNPNDED